MVSPTRKTSAAPVKLRRESPKPKERDKDVIYWSEYDHVIFACVIVLLLFGVIMVLSSSYYIALKSPKMSTFAFAISQGRAALIGFPIMLVAAIFNYRNLRVFTIPLYLGSLGLVVATKWIGVEIYGAKRWIEIPVLGTFQPSEMMKLALILLLAFYICGGKSGNRTKSLGGLVGCALITLIPALCVFIFNNNMSTALIIVMIGLGITFIACPYWKPLIIAGGGLLGLALGAGYYLFKFVVDPEHKFFRWAVRIRASIDPWSDPTDKGFQTIQSLYAVASGGLVGLGLGQSNQKLKYLSEPQNDFIFAVICEELGFFGALSVLFFFGVLIWRCARVAMNATDLLGCLIAAGVITQIAVQVIVNVSVVTNTGINTGVPLPFISAGGTSLLIIMASMGVLLNISRFSRPKS